MDDDELRSQIDKIIIGRNNQGEPDFDGYSPDEMFYILYFPYEAGGPVKILQADAPAYSGIPVLNQVKYLMGLILSSGEIKLTPHGFLPTGIVSELYSQGFIRDELIESGIYKLRKETDANSVRLTHILLVLSGLAKKRNGKLSATKAAEKVLNNNHELLRLIFVTFATKFNWAYFDGFGENSVAQLGSGFSMILLSRYGKQKRPDSFYAKKYFTAFPMLLEGFEDSYSTLEKKSTRCYSLRTFKRFLQYFGFIEINREVIGPEDITFISTTPLFDQFIACTPNKSLLHGIN